MHLTNYSINKHSKDFVRDEESGSKRRITTINKWFVDNGYNLQKIWDDIDVRTCTVCVTNIIHVYCSRELHWSVYCTLDQCIVKCYYDNIVASSTVYMYCAYTYNNHWSYMYNSSYTEYNQVLL